MRSEKNNQSRPGGENTSWMYYTTVSLLTGLLFFCGASLKADSFLPPLNDPNDIQVSEHPLADTINQFLLNQASHPENFTPTGLSRADYLQVVNGQVNAMRPYQDAEGRIIDPVTNAEMYYTTPCYAHCVAILIRSGYNTSPDLLNSGIKAMDVGVNHLYNDTVPGNHGDFFTWPLMQALAAFDGYAPAAKVNEWMTKMAAIVPSAVYNAYGAGSGNWALVHTAGEYLRFVRGMTSLDYVELILSRQVDDFTNYGMYLESGQPLPYDHFARRYVGGMLQNGYRGSSYEAYRRLIWKGAWTSLFMQSPFGELPTGYRSSHHIWNEAESAITYEIYAGQYAAIGCTAQAGAFKRAAMLSLQCIRNWIRPDGSGYIVKNKYPIEARYGYEGYSEHTCYNMLAMSMLAEAWSYADDAIAEAPAPADVGGFVVPILSPFHKIFANAGGNYIEYDTSGDHVYNPTGLIRVHLKGGHPQTGPSDGCASKYSGTAVNYAVGPSWKNTAGQWQSLAALSPSAPLVTVLEETPERVRFSVSYTLTDAAVSEQYSIDKGGVQVIDHVVGTGLQSLRIHYPMLIFNGQEDTLVRTGQNYAVLRLEGRQTAFIVQTENVYVNRTGQTYGHRNGMVEILNAEMDTLEAQYKLYVPISGDFDVSGRVDLADFALFANHWLDCGLIPASACNEE